MDLFGVCVIAFLTALGGGTIRDVVLGNFPVGWTQHPEYIYIVLGAGVLTTCIARYIHHARRVYLVLDALGLIAFSLIGSKIAMQMEYHTVVVVMAGMITGICGGVLRDVLCNEVPVVFQKELYAVISLCTCVLFIATQQAGWGEDISTLISFLFGTTFRILAIWQSWNLPRFSYDRHWE